MADSPLLSRLDLNLLVALDALLTERSVTRAALQRQMQKAEDLVQRAGESIVFQRQMIITLERGGRHYPPPFLMNPGH